LADANLMIAIVLGLVIHFGVDMLASVAIWTSAMTFRWAELAGDLSAGA
jgi:hypothetical protein